MFGGEVVVFGEEDRAVLATRDVLRRVEVVAQALEPFPSDQDELGAAGSLHGTKEHRLIARVRPIIGVHAAATPTIVVSIGHDGRALFTDPSIRRHSTLLSNKTKGVRVL